MAETISPKTKKRPFLPPEFVRAMLAGHSALGLAFAALIYVVCLSGTLCVFVLELHRWEQPNVALVDELTPEAVGNVLRAGYAQAKADDAAHDMFLFGPERVPGRFGVSYHKHENEREGHWLADETGQLVTREAAPWSEFIGELHMQLHLPRAWGLYLVGLTGVALLSSLISGLLSHPRIFKDAFALRWGGSRRLQEADLHNRLGVWGLPFHLVVTLTGALLGLSTLIIGVLALAAYDGDREQAVAEIFGPRASEDETAAPLPDIAAMIASIQQTEPDSVFSSAAIEHIGTAGQLVRLGMHRPDSISFNETYHFNAAGERIGADGQSGATGRWILGAIQPLHFGWFGGLPVKLLYAVLGLALTIVTHSGVVIWLARRRDKGRPAPGWEKVWAAVGWGQPLAFGTTAMVGIALGGGMLVETYLATLVAALGVAWLAGSDVVAVRALRLLSALAIVGAVSLHIYTWGDRSTDPMAWQVNFAMLACAAAIALPVLWSGATRLLKGARQPSPAA